MLAGTLLILFCCNTSCLHVHIYTVYIQYIHYERIYRGSQEHSALTYIYILVRLYSLTIITDIYIYIYIYTYCSIYYSSVITYLQSVSQSRKDWPGRVSIAFLDRSTTTCKQGEVEEQGGKIRVGVSRERRDRGRDGVGRWEYKWLEVRSRGQ